MQETQTFRVIYRLFIRTLMFTVLYRILSSAKEKLMTDCSPINRCSKDTLKIMCRIIAKLKSLKSSIRQKVVPNVHKNEYVSI